MKNYKFGLVNKKDNSGSHFHLGSVLLDHGTKQEAFMLALKRFHFDSSRYALKLYEID